MTSRSLPHSPSRIPTPQPAGLSGDDLFSGGRKTASRYQSNKLKLYISGVLFPEDAEKQ
jgi:hypothetical protein